MHIFKFCFILYYAHKNWYLHLTSFKPTLKNSARRLIVRLATALRFSNQSARLCANVHIKR